MNHCTRCGCSLDIGDTAPATTAHGPMCVSCDMILKGADPYEAMLEASSKKQRAIEAEACR
jgi:hypothetical protein